MCLGLSAALLSMRYEVVHGPRVAVREGARPHRAKRSRVRHLDQRSASAQAEAAQLRAAHGYSVPSWEALGVVARHSPILELVRAAVPEPRGEGGKWRGMHAVM